MFVRIRICRILGLRFPTGACPVSLKRSLRAKLGNLIGASDAATGTRSPRRCAPRDDKMGTGEWFPNLANPIILKILILTKLPIASEDDADRPVPGQCFQIQDGAAVGDFQVAGFAAQDVLDAADVGRALTGAEAVDQDI